MAWTDTPTQKQQQYCAVLTHGRSLTRARVLPLFFTKLRPLSTPAPPSRTCWKLPEGRVFPPNRRRSHRRGILLPSQGEIHRGGGIRSGEGGGAGRLLSLVEGQASGNRVPR